MLKQTALFSAHQQLGARLIDFGGWEMPLHYGEIVIFQPPIPGQPLYVKRVIATGGQTISMVDGQVFVDGKKMPQPYLLRHGVSTEDQWNMPPTKVPKGDIYVLGDHRAVSRDSRYFGPVPAQDVTGAAHPLLVLR